MRDLKCCDNADLDSEKTEDGYDKTDKPPNSRHVTCFTYSTLVVSIFLNLLDLSCDIYVAHSYFETERYSFFAWSVAFILLPSIILSLISIRMYVEDISNGKLKYKHSLWRIILCIIGIPIQSAPLIRNCDTLYYAVKASLSEMQSDRSQQIEYFNKMLYEDSDTAFLKVFEAYLESAPQVVLQTTLLLVDYASGSTVHIFRQSLSIISGFLSMAYSMANYNKCIRLEQKHKQNPSISALIVYFLWHLTFTVSRILAILTLAVLSPFWTCITAVMHWCGMTVWLAVSNKTSFCGSNKIFEVFFSCAVGAVYIFNFVNVEDGPTKKQYLVFFLLFFFENTTITIIWGVLSTFKNLYIYYILLIFPLVCFLLSIVFMIVYYKFLHPSKVKSKNLHKQESAVEQRLTYVGEHTDI